MSEAYLAYAPEDDVDGFMASLGYEDVGTPSQRLDNPAGLQKAFQRALKQTDPVAYNGKPDSEMALAAATHARLREWMQEYDYLLPVATAVR